MAEFQTFVVPYDFSEHARAALRMATDLARRFESRIHLLHVIQPPSLAYLAYGGAGTTVAEPVAMLELHQVAESALGEVAASIEGEGPRVEAHVVESASIPEAICEFAEKVAADLIVMGTHGRTGLAHAFLGSVAERTLRRAPCAVLTVRANDDARAAVSDH
ncbi:MAG TPA: universal stress protein [Myxococcota bacterium]|nr:universal stress protein [Myxococcota bacterium]